VQSCDTRTKLILIETGLRDWRFHAFPGLAHIEKALAGYRVVPMAWNSSL
jgi:hypothetical protein